MNATDVLESASEEAVPLISPRRTRIDHSHHADPSAPTPEAGDAAQATTGTPLIANSPSDDLNYLEVEQPTDEMVAAVLGQNLDVRREQLQLQVSQLAEHLRERLREVDRREAAVNARASQLETDMRASRMWLREREMEFQKRESELRRQIEELREQSQQRPREAESIPFDAEARQAELNAREEQLLLREDDLREKRFEFDRQSAALLHAQQVSEQQREQEERQLASRRQQMTHDFEQLFVQREEQLQTAEALLNEHAQRLDRDRTALAADRQAWEEQRSRQKDAIDELRNSTEAELTDQRARLTARQEWIERQRAGLEQVRDEALRLHRQALEMRLLAEQLWAQITGALTPAEATQAIAQLRLKLAEQYKVEEQQLVTLRGELVQLAERIAEQHRELTQLRGGVREWVAARQAEIEQQAAMLVQRELALDTQQEGFRQSQQQWNSDRRQYEQQIRDLTSQLRTQLAAA